MKISIRSFFIGFVSLTILLSGCAPAATPLPPTSTALPTSTPKPTNTLVPTRTPVPTRTTTPLENISSYKPAPRWMTLAQPGAPVGILGEKWNYVGDRWGETYGCSDYDRDTGTYISFEQCFALISEELTFESVQSNFLADGFEALEPNNNFGSVGQISLLGKRLTGTSKKTIGFYEVIGTEKYILLVELYIQTDKVETLPTIYEGEVSDIMNYVLQNMLEKSHLIPRPTATPLSPNQASYYDDLAQKLITEEGSNEIYTATEIGIGGIDGTWEALGDFVDPEDPVVCRDFEDRTHADVLWVYFSNCIILHHPDFTFDDLAESKEKIADNIFLKSSHQYDDKFILYGQFRGHTYFYGWMMHGDYLYYVVLETRTIGDANVENAFTKEVDDFIYNVLMINAK